MTEQNAANRLRQIRERTGLSIRTVAKAIGRSTSGYVFYEREYKKKYLPLEMAEELVPIFENHGIAEAETLSLAGLKQSINAQGEESYAEEPDIDKDDRTASASGALWDHIRLLHPEGVDEATPYYPESRHPDYGRKDDILNVIYPGEHPHSHLWIIRRSALDMAGYLPGDVVALDLSISPRPGDIVCATFPYDGKEVTGLRIFSPPFLLSASSIPQYKNPILIDNVSVIIHGVVMGMYRRRPT